LNVEPVWLTADGERYFAKISTAPFGAAGCQPDMLRNRRDADAELWISSLPFFTSAVLLLALPEFKRRNPHLTLRIEATRAGARPPDRRSAALGRRRSGAGEITRTTTACRCGAAARR
jgi:DNA-binding transcriptional LysR family regulator